MYRNTKKSHCTLCLKVTLTKKKKKKLETNALSVRWRERQKSERAEEGKRRRERLRERRREGCMRQKQRRTDWSHSSFSSPWIIPVLSKFSWRRLWNIQSLTSDRKSCNSTNFSSHWILLSFLCPCFSLQAASSIHVSFSLFKQDCVGVKWACLYFPGGYYSQEVRK